MEAITVKESVDSFDVSSNVLERQEGVSGIFAACLARTVERAAATNPSGDVNGGVFAFASAVQVESMPEAATGEVDSAALLGSVTLSYCLTPNY